MTTLREAAQQALEAMSSFESGTGGLFEGEFSAEIAALRAALAEPEDWELRRLREELERCKQTCAATSEAWREEATLAEPVECPHGVTDGNCKECYEAKAESVQKLVAWESSEDGRTIQNNDFTHDVVLRVTGDFENDKQRISYAKRVVDKLNAPALAEPVQEPVAWIHTDPDKPRVTFLEWREDEPGYRGNWIKTPLYTAPQRCPNCASLEDQNTELDRKLAKLTTAVLRGNGIGGK